MKRGLLLSAFLVVAALAVFGGLRWWDSARTRSVWTDGQTIHAADAAPRQVLWQPPQPLSSSISTPRHDYEPRFSWDGLTLFLVRGKAGGNADIYVAQRTASGWSEPQALTAVNSAADELGPAPSQDGRFLYFYSDRPGGLGGYDLWRAARGDGGWGDIENLGAAVNSAFNDYGPAPSPDGAALFFSSNRPAADAPAAPRSVGWPATIREDQARRTYDLYRAPLSERGVGLALPIAALNSTHNEGAPSVAPAGDFLYFASDRSGGHGGFDLYRSRLLRGEAQLPENLGPALNTPAHELDPGLTALGFALIFSSDRLTAADASAPGSSAGDAEPDYNLYYTESREVFVERERIAYESTDWLALWQQVLPNLLWMLLAALLVLLLWMLWRDARDKRLSLMARCLVASLMAHALLMLLLSFWRVTSEIVEFVKRDGPIQIALSMPASDSITTQLTASAIEAPQAQPVSLAVAPPERVPFELPAPQTASTPSFEPLVADASLAPVLPPAPTPASSLPPPPQAPLTSAGLAAIVDVPLDQTARVSATEPTASAVPPAAPTASTAPLDAPAQPSAAPPTVARAVVPPLSAALVSVAAPALMTPAANIDPSSQPPREAPSAPDAPSVATRWQAAVPQVDAPPRVVTSEPSVSPVPALAGTPPPAPAATVVVEAPAAPAVALPAFLPDAALLLSQPTLPRAALRPALASDRAPRAVPAPPPAPLRTAQVTLELPAQPEADPAPRAAQQEPAAAAPVAASLSATAPPPLPFRTTLPPVDSPPVARLAAPDVAPRSPDILLDVGHAPASVQLAADAPPRLPRSAQDVAQPLNLDLPQDVLTPAQQRAAQERDAIRLALAWLARHQHPDGRWSAMHFDERCGGCADQAADEMDVLVTSMALIAFIQGGCGPTAQGPLSDAAARGADWLAQQVSAAARTEDLESPFSHAAALIALSSLAGDADRDNARAALQHGFRALTQTRQDAPEVTSAAWRLLALSAAMQTGLTAPHGAIADVEQVLDAAERSPGLYALRPEQRPGLSATAAGAAARLLLGEPTDSPRSEASRAALLSATPSWKRRPDPQAWLLALPVLARSPAPEASTWRDALRETVLEHQVREGPAAGSWPAVGPWAESCGRVHQTALCVILLQGGLAVQRGEVGPQQGRVIGVVRSTESGAPLEGALVRIDRSGLPPLVTRTDADGAYDLAAADLPRFFAVSAAAPGYVPQSRNASSRALQAEGLRIDFALTPTSRDLIALEADPQVHHLGNDRFQGAINSQFQRESEGEIYEAAFEVAALPEDGQAAVLLLVKGVQCPHRILVNGQLLRAKLDASPPDGSFGEIAAAFDAALLQPGVNTVRIEAVSCRGDLDDFEFVNVRIRLGAAPTDAP